ncbi:MAG: DUF2953 domain-containing protein, partial [Angelakisella sp.]
MGGSGLLKWIVWALLALLALLLFCQAQIKLLSLDGTVTVKLRLLHLFKFTLYPQKPKPEKPKGEKAKAEKPPPPKSAKKKEAIPIGDIIETINDLLPQLGRSLDYWLRHITIERLLVRAVIHREDAADTAIDCGRISAAGYTLYAWCSNIMKIKEFSFNAVPNFTNEAEPINVALHVSAAPGALLWGLLLFIARGGIALWRGPLISQIMKKQPRADNKNKNPQK